ncbi:GspH/FimT family pseudopilin [Paraglaciecola hydrolytica]|uniref:Type II secretion system protein H n=1 Tax=Paraglaciecola hydrolytica TaxID=1799789 RepID=A0A148KLK3_9ALTE|nr:GspH/FimT family pseudopilin [Paraglaciecola hydrolytica]KXI27204.1 prepilin peptidase dependent protein A [Paraglaciecola hydrolytica]
MSKSSGITLLELLTTISIITLVLTLGVPAILSVQKTMQLKGAVEVSYFALLQARATAVATRRDVHIALNAGKNWCIALSDHGLCDCTVYNACTIEGVEQKIHYSDFHLIELRDLKFGQDNVAVFDGVRGLAIGNAGSVVFSDGGNLVKLVVSNMGRVRICVQAGKLGAYEPC